MRLETEGPAGVTCSVVPLLTVSMMTPRSTNDISISIALCSATHSGGGPAASSASSAVEVSKSAAIDASRAAYLAAYPVSGKPESQLSQQDANQLKVCSGLEPL